MDSLKVDANVKLVWKNATGQYESGKRLYAGKWYVGGFHRNVGKARGSTDNWIATCSLPGIKDCLGKFEQESEAMKKVENAVSHWFSGLSLEV